MKPILSAAGFMAASIAAAGAANYTDDTVGTFNGNGKTILEATGNSPTSATFATDIATAFANNTGGVWDFDGAGYGVAPGETITLNYGTSLANSLVLTLGGTSGIDQSANGGEATSGGFVMGLAADASTRVFTPSKPLLTVGIFNTNRGDAGRIPVLTVTYQDNTTASTSGANAGAVYFHGLSGTEANPIKSFSISQNAFVRYDDLGFIVAPEAPPTDTDDDGLIDSWEIQYFTDITTTAGGPTEDWDADGMTDKEEHDNGTNPTVVDTDSDGLWDGEEFSGATNDYAPNTPTNPADADSDNDGVNDSDENGSLNFEFGNAPTNPNSADSDGDGMSDDYELANNTSGTALDPNDDGTTDATQAPGADRDGDGLSNIAEFDPSQGPNFASPQTRADLADTDSDGLSDLVEDNTNFWSSVDFTGTDPTDSDSDDDGLLDGQENYDLISYPGTGEFPTNSDPNVADTDGDGYNDKFEANNGFDPNDSGDVPVRATVGVINPDAGPNGVTVVDSPANVGNAKFITVAAMGSLMTSKFADNTGGVINWDAAQGWFDSGTSFSVAYGASKSKSLTISLAPPVDGGAPTLFGTSTGGGTTATSSSTYLAFGGGSGAGTPVTFNFSEGLSAWGITQLARPGDRTVTMSFTLADTSVITYAPDTVTDSSSTLNWYGIQFSSLNPIMSVTITSVGGLVRYDDMAFVVSGTAGYSAWATDNGATGQTKDLDHDGDGVDNGIEYFMGQTDSTFTANPAAVSGTVTWPMAATYTGTYGTDYEVQYSTDLVIWTKANEGTGDNTVTVNPGPTPARSVVYDVPTGGKSFVRLVVKN
jgi:hypothetical protein